MDFNTGTQAEISVAPGFISGGTNAQTSDAPGAAERCINLRMHPANTESAIS
jgi:hypothetical protein